MAFSKQMAQQNREMLARALQLLDHSDLAPLNYRNDKDRVLETMASEWPGIPIRRIKGAVIRALHQIRVGAKRLEEKE